MARASALLLATGGILLLFAADVVLPYVSPGYPRSAAWLGQLLGAAWLALAVITWLTRSTAQGGIYGRPIVLANVTVYFMSTMVLLRNASRADSAGLWMPAAIAGVMALLYLLRMLGAGPRETIATGSKEA